MERERDPSRLTAFAEQYQAVKVAEYDAQGRVLSVSNAVNLLDDNAFAYATELIYRPDSRTLTINWETGHRNAREWLEQEPMYWGLVVGIEGCFLLLVELAHTFYLHLTKKRVRKWHWIPAWMLFGYSCIALLFFGMLCLPYFAVSFIPREPILPLALLGDVVLVVLSGADLLLIWKRRRNAAAQDWETAVQDVRQPQPGERHDGHPTPALRPEPKRGIVLLLTSAALWAVCPLLFALTLTMEGTLLFPTFINILTHFFLFPVVVPIGYAVVHTWFWAKYDARRRIQSILTAAGMSLLSIAFAVLMTHFYYPDAVSRMMCWGESLVHLAIMTVSLCICIGLRGGWRVPTKET